jgi:hypothetical protein
VLSNGTNNHHTNHKNSKRHVQVEQVLTWHQLSMLNVFWKPRVNGLYTIYQFDIFCIANSKIFFNLNPSTKPRPDDLVSRETFSGLEQKNYSFLAMFLKRFASTVAKGTPPPPEGFMAGLSESKLIKHTRDQALANKELQHLGKNGIPKHLKYCCS